MTSPWRFWRTDGDPVDDGQGSQRVPSAAAVDAEWAIVGSQIGHLPQPEWFGHYAVSIQECAPDSTLSLYRRALALRGHLFAGTDLAWVASEASVLHFKRPGGVRCISNFGAEPIALPDGDVHLSSVQLADGRLPSDATAWLRMR